MPALGHQHDFVAPRANRLAHQRLAVGIALGGIDNIDPRIERGVQNFVDGFLCDSLVADFRPAKPKRRNPQPGLAQQSIFNSHKNESEDYCELPAEAKKRRRLFAFLSPELKGDYATVDSNLGVR